MPHDPITRHPTRARFRVALSCLFPLLISAPHGARAEGCNCSDLVTLQHRLEEVTTLVGNLQGKLQAAGAGDPATQSRWQAFETELKIHLQTQKYQHPATPANAALINNSLDPSCGAQHSSFGACLDQVWAAHQQAHEQSCNAGRWSWQNAWAIRDMLQEEISADQAEIGLLQAEIARLSCQCPHFMIIVQVITTTSANAGPLTERSGRSYNGMNGVRIPIVLQDDGTFDGFGSGADAGTARGQAGPDLVTSQFGNQVFIRATGKIQPGDCTTRPCKPDMMHLVLTGATSQQANVAHATAPGVNMTIRDTTPGGQGVQVFDLPAYVGSSAQRTFLATSMIHSNMTVLIAPAASSQAGGDTAAAGASLLYAVLECRLARVVLPPAPNPGGGPGGSGGGMGAGGAGGPAAAGGGGIGGGLPGRGHQNEVLIAVREPIRVSDTVLPPASVNVAEAIQVSDAVLPPVSVTASESISVTDTVLPPVSMSVAESVKISDSVVPQVSSPTGKPSQIKLPPRLPQ